MLIDCYMYSHNPYKMRCLEVAEITEISSSRECTISSSENSLTLKIMHIEFLFIYLPYVYIYWMVAYDCDR